MTGRLAAVNIKINNRPYTVDKNYTILEAAKEDVDPGKKHNQLKSMNKTELKEYGATIGLDLDMELKQAEMIERIQEREREVAEGNGEGVN